MSRAEDEEQEDVPAVVLAVGLGAAAIITEGDDEDEFEFLSFGGVSTQIHRQVYVEDAAAAAEDGLLAIVREENIPPEDWGRWLAELEHADLHEIEVVILPKRARLPALTLPVADNLVRPLRMAMYTLRHLPKPKLKADAE